jgi:hypothetical protein
MHAPAFPAAQLTALGRCLLRPMPRVHGAAVCTDAHCVHVMCARLLPACASMAGMWLLTRDARAPCLVAAPVPRQPSCFASAACACACSCVADALAPVSGRATPRHPCALCMHSRACPWGFLAAGAALAWCLLCVHQLVVCSQPPLLRLAGVSMPAVHQRALLLCWQRRSIPPHRYALAQMRACASVFLWSVRFARLMFRRFRHRALYVAACHGGAGVVRTCLHRLRVTRVGCCLLAPAPPQPRIGPLLLRFGSKPNQCWPAARHELRWPCDGTIGVVCKAGMQQGFPHHLTRPAGLGLSTAIACACRRGLRRGRSIRSVVRVAPAASRELSEPE